MAMVGRKRNVDARMLKVPKVIDMIVKALVGFKPAIATILRTR
jgi:hypothetical protein